MLDLRLEPRTRHSTLASFAVSAIAVGLTLIGGSIVFAFYGISPVEGFHAFLIEPLTSRYGVGEILLKMGPLLLIAQGLAIGFRARVWNIGAEGQLILGAIAGGWLAIATDGSESPWILPSMVILGAFAGMAWAAIAAYLRTAFNANEILVTFMLSSIALQLLYYLVTGPLRDPMGFNFPQSILFSDAALFGVLLEDTRTNTAVLIAITATLAAWLFMQRSLWGYKLVVGGVSPAAARYAGFSETRAVWISLLVGGAAAGIAGVAEVAGSIGMLQRNISPGYGFAAITVAFLGALHPIGIVFSSALMALIYVGGDFARLSVGLPSAVTHILQGMLLLFYLASAVLLNHRLRRTQHRVADGATT
ncbi:MAG: ABC transporter permease [Pseudomonadota bacterium]